MAISSYGTTRSTRPAPSTTAAARRAANPAWRHVDLLLVAAIAAVSLFGALMIYSATRNTLAVGGGSPSAYVRKQLIFTGIGFLAMVVVALVDYRHYRDWAPVLYGGTVLMLVAVFAVGHKSMGAQAWFQIGSYQLEPSEFAKLGLILALAAFLSRGRGEVRFRTLLLVLGLSIVPFALIYKQPALGVALVLVAVLFGMLTVAGTKGRYLLALTVLAVVAVTAVLQLGVMKQYQRDRITAFLHAPVAVGQAAPNPYSSTIEYNLEQSKTTIADGGLSGRGLFKGPQTNLAYVPNQSTDFIFTAVGEQFGFLGSLAVLGLFALVIWRSWRAALLARDMAGTLICVGVICMLVFQIFENIGMTIGIMPVAGITLPFMSYGGSSMLVDWMAIGLVLNVNMRRFA